MAQPLPHYLRARRLGTALTQEEMAFLLGLSDGSRISRYEAFKRMPDLEVALAYVAVHQGPVQELFAGKYFEVAAKVLERAHVLRQRLAGQPNCERKVEVLSVLILALERGFDLQS